MPRPTLACLSDRPGAAVRPWVPAALAGALLAGCGAAEPAATQTAARVNKDEITVHQIGAALAPQSVPAEQTLQAERQALERLIDRQLAVQQAASLKLDREPKVVQAIETARHEILARAYADRLSERVARATPLDVKRYYDDHPALFAERRVYELQQFAIEADAALIARLEAALPTVQSADQVRALLQSLQVKHEMSRVVRAAEQLPMSWLPALSRVAEGQSLLQPAPRGVQWIIVQRAQMQPVALDRATATIEQFLLNEQKRQLLADDLKALRASAKVDYVGRFAGTIPVNEAPAASAATASTGADALKAGTIDASTINKGLGLK
jgi:EpsD family peptidyl-prolyl cis-trans isomerase